MLIAGNKFRSRLMDPLVEVAGVLEAYDRLTTEATAVRYIIGSMQPIDSEYTRRTIEERDRVEKQLADGYRSSGLWIEFDYQGSLTNDTHVRVYSDVHLLTIIQRWYTLEPPNKPPSPYQGTPTQHLKELRHKT